MGDMADYYLDSYEPDYWGEDDTPFERVIMYKTCSQCGQRGLMWMGKYRGKWRLGDPHTGKVHICSSLVIK